MDIPEVDEREDLSEEEIAKRIKGLHRGDRILFNDRKVPLKVTKKDMEGQVSIGDDLSGIEVEGESVRYILSPTEAMFHRKGGIVRRTLNWVQKVR